ncbi:uncharacterized protein LOC126335867 [Schistocerca gregaria]|uniref:uncharacterized protein LOC126335867 n=1 Tax=Schistocerca gregaria TaxID=7010 RepID=UPI00211F0782|nr:uncharacterized protein LOC126335867 [Schistocerca gregaria]
MNVKLARADLSVPTPTVRWRTLSQWPEQQLLGMVSCALALLGSRLLGAPELAPLTQAPSSQQVPPLTILLALLPILAPAVLLYVHTARRLLRTCALTRHRIDEIRSDMHLIHKERGLSARDSAWLYSVSVRRLIYTEGSARTAAGGDAGSSRSVGVPPRLRPCSARR